MIIPLLQVFWTTSAILQGGVYFKEFEKFSPIQTVGFCLGVIVVFIGVFLLTPTKHKDEEGIERALISPNGIAESTDDIETSSNGSSSVLTDPLPPLNAAGMRESKKHTFTNTGLSMHGSSLGDHHQQHSMALDRLVSLTYMPVVVNDASIAFYMDQAFVSAPSYVQSRLRSVSHSDTRSETSVSRHGINTRHDHGVFKQDTIIEKEESNDMNDIIPNNNNIDNNNDDHDDDEIIIDNKNDPTNNNFNNNSINNTSTNSHVNRMTNNIISNTKLSNCVTMQSCMSTSSFKSDGSDVNLITSRTNRSSNISMSR